MGRSLIFIAVGQPVTRQAPHRSRRAELPHRALQKYSLPYDNPLGYQLHVSRSEVGTVYSALHVRVVFPLRVAYPCQLLPRVNGVTVSEYYELIRLPKVIGFPT